MHFHAGDVVVEDFLGEQLSLLRFAAGIADGTRRAASHRNRMMAEQLKAPQRQQRNEIADVQTVRRRDRSRNKV